MPSQHTSCKQDSQGISRVLNSEISVTTNLIEDKNIESQKTERILLTLEETFDDYQVNPSSNEIECNEMQASGELSKVETPSFKLLKYTYNNIALTPEELSDPD